MSDNDTTEHPPWKFYTVSFRYRRPEIEEMQKWLQTHDPATEFSPENSMLSKAEDLSSGHLSRMKIRHLYEYSWPDGALCIFIMTDRVLQDVRDEFDKLEQARSQRAGTPPFVSIGSVKELSPDYKIFPKHNRMKDKGEPIKTVSDYFRVYVSQEIPDYILRMLHDRYGSAGFLDVNAV